MENKKRLRVCVIGSGNFGTAVSKIVGSNCLRHHGDFEAQMNMWTHQEVYRGRKITDIINKTHVNEKYLPGIKLPENVVAVPDLKDACAGADVFVFCLPFQFLRPVCKQLKSVISKHSHPFVISLCKGLLYDKNKKLVLCTDIIRQELGIECCSLSGANVANEVAREEFSETTIGFNTMEEAKVFQTLFDTPYFRVGCVQDVLGVEIAGALKNIVALAAGFTDGLKLGTNTKAAIIRIGMCEIRDFAITFLKGARDSTFWESAGFADLVTSCFGGRHRLCGEMLVKTEAKWEDIERVWLKGQKLQGTLVTRAIYSLLKDANATAKFPLFTTVYRILEEGAHPKEIVRTFMSDKPRPIMSKL